MENFEQFGKQENLTPKEKTIRKLQEKEAFDSVKFSKLVTTADSIDSLVKEVEKQEIFFGNGHRGDDHSEHIAKRISLFNKTRDFSAIEYFPSETKDRIEILSEKQDTQPISYQEYLQEFSPEMSKEQIETIEQKLPLDVFCSVDIPLEKSIVKMNSLDGVTTRFSCAGHLHNRRGLAGYKDVYIAYTDSNKIIPVKETYKEDVRVSVKDGVLRKGNDTHSVHFSPSITEDWLTEHKEIRPKDFFKSYLDEFSALYGEDVFYKTKAWLGDLSQTNELNLSYIIDNGFDYIRSDVRLFVGESSKKIKKATDVGKLLDLNPLDIRTKMFEKYKDFYIRDDAKNQRDEFIQSFEELVDSVIQNKK